jgi:hypothetical protein
MKSVLPSPSPSTTARHKALLVIKTLSEGLESTKYLRASICIYVKTVAQTGVITSPYVKLIPVPVLKNYMLIRTNSKSSDMALRKPKRFIY